MHVRQDRRVTKKGNCGPVHSPISIPRPHEQNKNQQAETKNHKKQTHKNKNQTQNPTNNEKKGHEGIAIRPERKFAIASYVCAMH